MQNRFQLQDTKVASLGGLQSEGKMSEKNSPGQLSGSSLTVTAVWGSTVALVLGMGAACLMLYMVIYGGFLGSIQFFIDLDDGIQFTINGHQEESSDLAGNEK